MSHLFEVTCVYFPTLSVADSAKTAGARRHETDRFEWQQLQKLPRQTEDHQPSVRPFCWYVSPCQTALPGPRTSPPPTHTHTHTNPTSALKTATANGLEAPYSICSYICM